MPEVTRQILDEIAQHAADAIGGATHVVAFDPADNIVDFWPVTMRRTGPTQLEAEPTEFVIAPSAQGRAVSRVALVDAEGTELWGWQQYVPVPPNADGSVALTNPFRITAHAH